MNKVSIIVPIYEVERELDQCLHSIEEQTYPNIEVIIVNDVTMDNSVTIAKRYCRSDERFTIIHNDVNKGLGGARNTGLDAATGEYVLFADSDDWLEPNMVEVLVRAMEAYDTSWAFCAFYIEDENGRWPRPPFHCEEARRAALLGPFDRSSGAIELPDIYPSTWLSLRRRDAILKAKARFPEKRYFEDHLFFYKSGLAYEKAVYVEDYLYHYRNARPGQITKDTSTRNLEIFDTIEEVLDLFAEHYSGAKLLTLGAKVSLRLIMERLLVVTGSPGENEFLARARDLLQRFDAAVLRDAKQHWYPADKFELLVPDARKRETSGRIPKTAAPSRIEAPIQGASEGVFSGAGRRAGPGMPWASRLQGFIKSAAAQLKSRSRVRLRVKLHDKSLAKIIEPLTERIGGAERRMAEAVTERVSGSLPPQLSGQIAALNNVVASCASANAALDSRLDRLERLLFRLSSECQASQGAVIQALSGPHAGLLERLERLEASLTSLRQTAGEQVSISAKTAIAQAEVERRLREMERSLAACETLAGQQLLGRKEAAEHLDRLEEAVGRMKSEILGVEPVAYHRTWAPSVIPAYFQGNIWTWADGFKKYATSHAASIPDALAALKSGLDIRSQALADAFWETCVRKIPYSEYSKVEGFLLNRDFIFTKNDLSEQRIVRESFERETAPYVLPEGMHAEIPAFHYHHGLKNFDKQILESLAGSDFIDCGAYAGDSALVFSAYRPSSITCVEPHPDNCALLNKVIRDNQAFFPMPVHILNAGVGEAKAVAKVFGGGAAATAVQAGLIGGALHQEHEIQLASIDDIVVENQLKPGLIKFDIEGMESAAIRGAALTLARYRPILLISVYHTPEDFLYIKPFIESLGLGYSFRLEHHNPFDPIYETVLVCVPSAAAWKG